MSYTVLRQATPRERLNETSFRIAAVVYAAAFYGAVWFVLTR